MNDYLSNLIAKNSELAEVIQSRPLSLFEPFSPVAGLTPGSPLEEMNNEAFLGPVAAVGWPSQAEAGLTARPWPTGLVQSLEPGPLAAVVGDASADRMPTLTVNAPLHSKPELPRPSHSAELDSPSGWPSRQPDPNRDQPAAVQPATRRISPRPDEVAQSVAPPTVIALDGELETWPPQPTRQLSQEQLQRSPNQTKTLSAQPVESHPRPTPGWLSFEPPANAAPEPVQIPPPLDILETPVPPNPERQPHQPAPAQLFVAPQAEPVSATLADVPAQPTPLPRIVAQPQVKLAQPVEPVTLPVREQLEQPALPPTVQVTIGRIEVRATPPPAPSPQKQRSSPPILSLDEYLRQRANGGNR